ncbi:ABC transporter substrate-binding protein [Aquibacillus saliphilus]|uniref:ABC transporter substrate-binding protein n=1 Tax=Aquibacillus saliphilus TaxID=1909422 RepID=UPI001CF047FD|nr:iron-siderophore ABC transporter substrate-binding protein [Aquibacillus saliphilus]
MGVFTYSLSKSKLICLLAILLASIVFLTACGDDGTESNNEDKEQGQAESEDQSATESEDVREISHAMGDTTIEGTPKRIVTLYQGATDTIVAFDVKPVGAVESWLQQPTYEYLSEDLEGVEIVGTETQPNLEEIAKLNPDLIIASALRHEEIYDQLTEIAPTVAHETVFDFKGTVELMGEAINQEEKANELLTAWDDRVKDFQGKVTEKLGDEWPKNVSILNFRADHARIYFTGFAGSILAELGFTRPENQQSDEWGIQLTDKESIPEMNADVFYIFNEEDPAVEQTFEEWKNHPLWDNLDAVKNDQVYMVDEIIWNMGGGIKAANLMLDDIYDRFELE